MAGDKAYGSVDIRTYLQGVGAGLVSPPKRNAKDPELYDKEFYKRRNIVERFFCRLKDFRRVSMRFDKLLSTFEAFVALAAFIIYAS
ncbi:MAG: transposase [Eubacteriaceae bacterium]|nr:transposase [Eubacteriaceae bacterium]